MKSNWLPTWEIEGRPPTFVGCGPPLNPYGRLQKYLWGNMPALDVLALDRNEGISYDHDLHVLFAGRLLPLYRTSSIAYHSIFQLLGISGMY
jgi:hypothetical protein